MAIYNPNSTSTAVGNALNVVDVNSTVLVRDGQRAHSTGIELRQHMHNVPRHLPAHVALGVLLEGVVLRRQKHHLLC